MQEEELSWQDKIIVNGVRTYILGFIQSLTLEQFTDAILANAYPIYEIIDAEIPDILIDAMPLIMQYKEKLINMVTYEEMMKLAKENRSDLAKALNTMEGYKWSLNFLKIVKFFIENIELPPPQRHAKFEKMINEKRAIAEKERAIKQKAIQERQEAEQRAREEQERLEQDRLAQMQRDAEIRIAMENQRLMEIQRTADLKIAMEEQKLRENQKIKQPSLKKKPLSTLGAAELSIQEEDDDSINKKPLKIDRNITSSRHMSTF